MGQRLMFTCSKKIMAESTKLEAWRVKELLQDIEAENTLLADIKLLDICTRNTKVYGLPYNNKNPDAKAGLIRRAVQKKFDLLKRLSPENYRKLLQTHRIQPSPTSLAWFGDNNSDNSSVSSVESPSNSSRHSSFSKKSESTKQSFPCASFAKMSIRGDESPPSYLTLSRSSRRSTVMSSPPPIFGSPGSVKKQKQGTGLYRIPPPADQPDGSEENPYIIHINIDYPERNMGFEVLFLSGVMNGADGFEYDIFTFRKTICFNDRVHWEAYVAHDKIPPEFQYRAIMVTGPAVGKFAREVDKVHNSKNKKNPKCVLSFTARKKTITGVDTEPGRKKVHYLFITPPDFYLDNQIFGNNNTELEPLCIDIAKNHPANDNRIYTGTQIIWRIACRGGRQVDVHEKAPVYDEYD